MADQHQSNRIIALTRFLCKSSDGAYVCGRAEANLRSSARHFVQYRGVAAKNMTTRKAGKLIPLGSSSAPSDRDSSLARNAAVYRLLEYEVWHERRESQILGPVSSGRPRKEAGQSAMRTTAPRMISILRFGFPLRSDSEAAPDPRGQMPGVRSAGMGQFLHLRLVPVGLLVFRVVVEGSVRNVVDEGLRLGAVGEDDFVLQ